jgi:hypothetical protein
MGGVRWLAIALAIGACGPSSGSDDADSGEESTGDVPVCELATGAGTLAWTMEGELEGSRSAVAVADGERVAVVGAVRTQGTRDDAIVEVRDADGGVAWSDPYDGRAGLEDVAVDVAVDAEGFVHVLVVETITEVLAETQATLDARLVVLRYGPAGERVWRWEREHPPAMTFEQYYPEGSLAIVEGRIAILELSWDEPIVRVELDRFGNVVSETALEKTVDLGVRAREIADDGVVVLGGDIEDNGEHQAWVARYGRDGALVWSDAFGTIDDRGIAVAAAPQGKTWFAWSNREAAQPRVSLRSYDEEGSELSTTPLDVGADGLALASACDGGVWLTGGVTREPLPDAQWDQRMTLWIARHADDGAVAWSIEEEMPAPYDYGSGHAIAATPSGRAFLVGSYLDATGATYAPWLGRVDG